MAKSAKGQRRLSDGYSFAGFRARKIVRGVFGDPDVRVVTLDRSFTLRNPLILKMAGFRGLSTTLASIRSPGRAGSPLARRVFRRTEGRTYRFRTREARP